MLSAVGSFFKESLVIYIEVMTDMF